MSDDGDDGHSDGEGSASSGAEGAAGFLDEFFSSDDDELSLPAAPALGAHTAALQLVLTCPVLVTSCCLLQLTPTACAVPTVVPLSSPPPTPPSECLATAPCAARVTPAVRPDGGAGCAAAGPAAGSDPAASSDPDWHWSFAGCTAEEITTLKKKRRHKAELVRRPSCCLLTSARLLAAQPLPSPTHPHFPSCGLCRQVPGDRQRHGLTSPLFHRCLTAAGGVQAHDRLRELGVRPILRAGAGALLRLSPDHSCGL